MRVSEFDAKTDINVDKTNSKIFQFKFASFSFVATGKLFYLIILYVRKSTLRLEELFVSLSFRRYAF